MSLSQVLKENEYELKAKTLDTKGDLVAGADVKGERVIPTEYQDKEATLSGAFSGTCRIQAQNYGEYTLVDVGELITTTTGVGRAIMASALDAEFRPAKEQIFTSAMVSRGNVPFLAEVYISPAGAIEITPITVSGGGATANTWTSGLTQSGWFNFSVCFWREQLVGSGRPAVSAPLLGKPRAP